MVVDYYRHLLEELRKALPYDAMGGQHTIPILVLQEFRKPDIVRKNQGFYWLSGWIFRSCSVTGNTEIYDRTSGPAGNYPLYGRIGKPAGGKECLQTGRTNVGKRKSISSSRYKHFYCRVAGSNQKYYTERFRGTCKGTSLPTGMGPGK